jgi:hypothetical protein
MLQRFDEKRVWRYAICWATIPMMVRLNSASQARSKTNPARVPPPSSPNRFFTENSPKIPHYDGDFSCNPVWVRSLMARALYLLVKCTFVAAAMRATIIAQIHLRTSFSHPTPLFAANEVFHQTSIGFTNSSSRKVVSGFGASMKVL